MTELYIDGQLAVLPEGFSFTFTSENPYFTRSSNYSMDVELPMPANYVIFKHVNRLDVTKEKTILPATLIVDGKCLLYGSAVLLSIEDTLVKVQLVSGNAEFNLLTNDDIYIDELKLGGPYVPPTPGLFQFFLPESEMTTVYGSVDEVDGVFLPVFYQEAKEENLVNAVTYEEGTTNFNPYSSYLIGSFQPYLLTVIKKLIDYFGYTFDTTFFDNNFLRNIYICSAVNSFRIETALPHWTISEFFNELEKFLGVVTVVDEQSKIVRFVELNNYFSNPDKEIINYTELLHEFTVDINEEKNDKDVTSGNVGYDLPSTSDDGYFRLDRNLLKAAKKIEYTHYQQMKNAYDGMDKAERKKVIFVVGKRYYINYNENETDTLREVNLYADFVRHPESDDTDVELKIVPAKIVQHNRDTWKRLQHNFDVVRTDTNLFLNIPLISYYRKNYNPDWIISPQGEGFNIQEAIDGDIELPEKQQKNDRMEIAFNTGIFNRQNVTSNGQTKPYSHAYPFTDYQQKTEAQLTEFLPYSLSLNDVCPNSMGRRLSNLKKFHSDIPYTIQFQADKLPDVNKVFLIGNKRYLCEKIEAEIDADGLNKVLKGTFYRIE